MCNEEIPKNYQMTQPPLVSVCIITFKRPKGLQRLLDSLRHLTFSDEVPPKWQVVIVDNDKNGSARAIVEQVRESFPVSIRYGIEPVQGIASARNKSVELATGCDFLAFIDDDEVADPFWLDVLLEVQNRFEADIVTGPVLPEFEELPPDWIKRGNFFARRRLSTGTEVHYAATHNMLIKSVWAHKINGPFDMKFNLTGGSDSHFSRKVICQGGKVVWAEEAIVKEFNPPERVKESWLLQRSFRLAYTTTLIEKELYSILIVSLRLIKAFYNMGTGIIVLIPFFIYYGYAGIIKAFQLVARGAGAIYGLLGGRYHEYARKKN